MLNPSKSKFIRFMSRPNFSIDGNEISEVDLINYLGLKIQKNLKWHHHVKQIRSKNLPPYALETLYKLRYKLDTTTKLMTFQSLI